MDGGSISGPRARLVAGVTSGPRRRWLAALGCTAVVHVLAATVLLLPWRRAVEPVAVIPVALLVAVPVVAAPPMPVPLPVPVPAPVPMPVPLPVPAAPLPATVPLVRPLARPVARVPAAAPAPAPAPATVTAAAAPAAVSVSPSWRQALAGWIAARKSYPAAARRRGTEGMVTLRFTVERSGRVVAVAVVRGSGSEALDEAALAILRDAEVPAFPADMAQDRTTETVNISYALTAPAG